MFLNVYMYMYVLVTVIQLETLRDSLYRSLGPQPSRHSQRRTPATQPPVRVYEWQPPSTEQRYSHIKEQLQPPEEEEQRHGKGERLGVAKAKMERATKQEPGRHHQGRRYRERVMAAQVDAETQTVETRSTASQTLGVSTTDAAVQHSPHQELATRTMEIGVQTGVLTLGAASQTVALTMEAGVQADAGTTAVAVTVAVATSERDEAPSSVGSASPGSMRRTPAESVRGSCENGVAVACWEERMSAKNENCAASASESGGPRNKKSKKKGANRT
eukprot:GHVU01116199.1.p1 GENE.GHVU01116199.1~~GHVU01116199.1.p1  ORF type:complete len:274 (-),score=41.62 GHVU01116199.1:99-920(-)